MAVFSKWNTVSYISKSNAMSNCVYLVFCKKFALLLQTECKQGNMFVVIHTWSVN